MEQSFIVVFQIITLIFSVIIHEVSHGAVANFLGDPTAKYEGRLTFNPLKHLDPMGSFIVPLITYMMGGFIFGWARPVPYNPYNLRNQKWGPAAVGLAGPAANFAMALFFGLILRAGASFGFFQPSSLEYFAALFYLLSIIVIINLVLGVFNLVPIPPLDGSKLLFAILPDKYFAFKNFMSAYGLVLLIIFILFFVRYIFPLVLLLFKTIVGSALLI